MDGPQLLREGVVVGYVHLLGGSNRLKSSGTASSTGTTITADSTADTKGAWVTIDASTAIPANGAWLQILPIDSAASFLIDVGFGATEVVVCPNLFYSGIKGVSSATGMGQHCYPLPIYIPAGTEVSVRCQSSTGSAAIRVSIILCGFGVTPSPLFQRLTAYGDKESSATSGTDITPNTTANLKGAWTEVDAACANPIRWLCVIVGNSDNYSLTADSDWLMDIGIGASPNEEVLIPDLMMIAGTAGDMPFPGFFGPFPVNVPEGTRLTARTAHNIASQPPDSVLDVTLYGAD